MQVSVLYDDVFAIQFHLPKWHKLLSTFFGVCFILWRTAHFVWSDKIQLWFF